MNKKLFLLLTAGIFALLASCGDSIVNAENNPIETKSKVPELVRDATTLVPITAKVTLLTTGQSIEIKETNGVTDGKAIFKDVRTGEHQVLVEKDGYAKAMFAKSNAPAHGASQNDIYIAEDIMIPADIYENNASLSGTVYYTTPNGVTKIAEGATVRLQYTSTDIIDRIVTAEVAGGKFNFEGLAAVANAYTLTALGQDFEGVTYATTNLANAARPNLVADATANITNTANPFVYAFGSSPFELLGYKNVIEANESVVLNFTQSVNVEKTGAITVSGATVEWSNDNKTLTIAPIGDWDIGTLNIGTHSFTPVTTTSSQSFTINNITVLAPDLNKAANKITVKWIDTVGYKPNGNMGGGTQSVLLRWEKINGVPTSGYNVYYKVSPRLINDFGASAGSYNNYIAASCGLEQTFNRDSVNAKCNIPAVNLTGLGNSSIFQEGMEVDFVVEAYNARSTSPLSDPIKVKDVVRPDVSSIGGYDVDSYGLRGSATDKFIDYSSTYYGSLTTLLGGTAASTTPVNVVIIFNEPMDVTAFDAATDVTTPGTTRLALAKAEWSLNRTTLTLTYNVSAVATVETTSADIKITGLKDGPNNLGVRYPNTVNPTEIVESLDIRIRTAP
jgi:hypothetical protein